jgi:hypothetical protein
VRHSSAVTLRRETARSERSMRPRPTPVAPTSWLTRGPWIFGRKVVIPAGTIERIDVDDKKIFALTKDQIKDSPEYDPTHFDGGLSDPPRKLLRPIPVTQLAGITRNGGGHPPPFPLPGRTERSQQLSGPANPLGARQGRGASGRTNGDPNLVIRPNLGVGRSIKLGSRGPPRSRPGHHRAARGER